MGPACGPARARGGGATSQRGHVGRADTEHVGAPRGPGKGPGKAPHTGGNRNDPAPLGPPLERRGGRRAATWWGRLCPLERALAGDHA